ncbi:hypothetical protein EL22_05210 [Halostagnicola sp. A56]|nr:hypothetical protein EL22_05210 [Halostagnicola sp. A56]
MSVEYRPPETPTHCVQRTANDSTTRQNRAPAEHTEPTPRTRDPLSARIERTRLRLRIAALERELEAKEAERQKLIDQYELVLEDRDAGSADSRADERGFVRRLLG